MQRIPLLPSMTGAALAVILGSQFALAVQDEDMNFDTTEDLYQVCKVQPGAAESVAAAFACRGFIEAGSSVSRCGDRSEEPKASDLLYDDRDRCGRARSLRGLGHAQCR